MPKKSNHKKFDANFTAGGLLFHEFMVLEKLITKPNNAELLKSEESQNVYMGIATLNARKRILSEIKRRMAYAPDYFWENYYAWSEKEQKLALLFLCLKTYPVVLDIHLEVTLPKYKIGANLKAYDITMRLDELASSHPEVESWSVSTIRKINVQYRKAIQDAGLMENGKLQIPYGLSDSFWNYFINTNENWFLTACFK
ncbi:BrxA family protein [Namhaeicola litoreus]|uniref:BrxA family protein n=1 Tax=Namhaeicola litoreus TaxID=1052145 RepID=A0ABW3Y2I8_9FLAO